MEPYMAPQPQYSRETGAEFHRSKVPSILEPYCLTRTDGKRPDGITLAPWEEDKQLVWDVTCVDLLAPSRIENGSVANPGTAAEDAEELKTAKYVCLTDKGYIFQPLAFEIQGGVGPSTSTFLKTSVKNCACAIKELELGRFQAETLSRNPGRQCGQCSWNGSGRRPLKRTLLLVNPRFNVRFVSLRNICLLCFVIVTISHVSLSF